jgi:hypothetical protein
VTVGTTGPMGSGFPQLGFPRRFAMGEFLAIPAAVSRNALVYHGFGGCERAKAYSSHVQVWGSR